MGATLATIALSNGSRVSELLQVSLDRRITHTENVTVLGPDGHAVLGHDGQPMLKQVKMHLQHLLPKGSKTEEEDTKPYDTGQGWISRCDGKRVILLMCY